MKQAFTMVELIFVIVIVGLLAAVAIPRFAATRDDAETSRLAQNIMGGVGEIGMYVTANGRTENDLTQMARGIKAIVDNGDAVNTIGVNPTIVVRFGGVVDCITVQITHNGNDDVLSLSKGASGDVKCDRLQNLIDTANYPMLLRGTNVVL